MALIELKQAEELKKEAEKKRLRDLENFKRAEARREKRA